MTLSFSVSLKDGLRGGGICHVAYHVLMIEVWLAILRPQFCLRFSCLKCLCVDGDLRTVTSHLINVCVLSCLSPVQLHVMLWTVAHQVPLSIGFSRQEYWSGLPCPSPGELPDPGMEPASPMSPAFLGRFFTTSTTWEAPPYI